MPAFLLNFEITREKKDSNTAVFDVRVTLDHTTPSKIHVYAKPRAVTIDMHEFYYACFERIDDDTVQSLVLTNNLPTEYQGLGLSAELILRLALHLQVRVRSSRRASFAVPHVLPSGAVDDRNSIADRFWESLVTRGLAEYSMAEDRYFYPR